MRGVLTGLAVFVVIGLLGFGGLVLLADGVKPNQEEVRVEIEDDFPR